ncbi:hypothetical protein [Vulgatibacter incomptus]|uniref:Lipoprotein n=1 Tax=Vulgatibacter incomptus TaxID=1391653 RepID=A0A0K1P9Z7_9BACT|nr:hypothetical protein [Vulgatibacter incomptus]AKU90340.1 hypothetical protein AKJ08_0727 [Vulgatibacter incomptus]
MSRTNSSTFASSLLSRLRLGLLPVVAALAMGLSGCIHYDDGADSRMYWTFAGRDCGRAGVDTVQIFIESRDGYVYDSAIVACERGYVDFYDLPSGDVWVTALGFDRRGAYATWDFYRNIRMHHGYNELTLELIPSGAR